MNGAGGHFPGAWGYYLAVYPAWGLTWSALFFTFVAGAIALFSAVTKQRSRLPSRLGKLALFLTILLFVSCYCNALWSWYVYGTVYVSGDVDDPDGDFSPFFPITQRYLDLNVHLLAGSLAQLQLIWFFLATAAWAISFNIYVLLQTMVFPLLHRRRLQFAPQIAYLLNP